MTRTRRARTVAVVLAAGLALAGCGGDDSAGSDSAVDAEVPAALDADVAGGGEAETEAMSEMAEDAAAEEQDVQDPGVEQPDATDNRDLVYRVTIGLSSHDPDQTVDKVEAAATAAGGFLSTTQLQRDDLGILSGSMTIRVPAANLDALLAAVSETAAEVTSRDQTVEDVTGQVADIEARLRNLRALEDELLVLLTEAREGGDTDDVLSVFDRVGDTRQEIEVLEGRQADLGEQVALSTVTVLVEPSPSLLASLQSEPDDDLPLPWSPGNVVANAWNATVSALQSFVDFGIRAVVFLLPVLAVWLSPLWLLLAVGWWWRRRRAARAGGPGRDGSSDGSTPTVPSSPPPATAAPMPRATGADCDVAERPSHEPPGEPDVDVRGPALVGAGPVDGRTPTPPAD